MNVIPNKLLKENNVKILDKKIKVFTFEEGILKYGGAMELSDKTIVSYVKSEDKVSFDLKNRISFIIPLVYDDDYKIEQNYRWCISNMKKLFGDNISKVERRIVTRAWLNDNKDIIFDTSMMVSFEVGFINEEILKIILIMLDSMRATLKQEAMALIINDSMIIK